MMAIAGRAQRRQPNDCSVADVYKTVLECVEGNQHRKKPLSALELELLEVVPVCVLPVAVC
jgi:hypothetical protein